MSDSIKKFLFQDRSVRVESVRLTEAWQQSQAHHNDPPCVTRLLGELVAAATLMAANIKFDGSLLLQLQGDGPIALMVAECRADMTIRATVKLRDREIPPDGTLQTLVNPHGGARFIVLLDPPKNRPGRQPYQGVVPLEADTIARALEEYMLRSEQLQTRIWLASDASSCAGLLLQQLPLQGGIKPSEKDLAAQSWERACMLGATLQAPELLATEQDTLMHRLFWEEPLIAFESREVKWSCGCTRERVVDMLRMLGEDEVNSILAEQGRIDVSCEFCGKPYGFDAVDATGLFRQISSIDQKIRH